MTRPAHRDPLGPLVNTAFRSVCDAEAIAHPAGLRDVLPHLYAAHTALLHARSALRAREKRAAAS